MTMAISLQAKIGAEALRDLMIRNQSRTEELETMKHRTAHDQFGSPAQKTGQAVEAGRGL